MATTVHVSPANGIGLVRYTETVELPVVLDGLYTLLAHPNWLPGYDIVWDCRGISELMIRPHAVDHLRTSVRDLRPLMGQGRSAIVVTREIDHLFARLLLFKMPHYPRERRVFRTVGAAMRWLTAPDDVLKAEKVALLQQWIQNEA